jgi:hypothetical protein
MSPNPNLSDIQVSMDIHGFTHYILQHFSIAAALQQHYNNISTSFKKHFITMATFQQQYLATTTHH